VFAGVFLRSASCEIIVSSTTDEIKRIYIGAGNTLVRGRVSSCIDAGESGVPGSRIIPRRAVFVGSIGIGDCTMHCFTSTLLLLCNKNI
jgi:hypothetical protein